MDDVSLATRLVQAGIPGALCPGAGLSTPLPCATLAGWRDWLTRQRLYLKFCMPLIWLAAGPAVRLLLALTLLAGLRLVLALLGMDTVWPGPDRSPILGWGCCNGCLFTIIAPLAGAALEVAGGLSRRHGDGQLVSCQDLARPGNALGRDYLPGGVTGEGDRIIGNQ